MVWRHTPNIKVLDKQTSLLTFSLTNKYRSLSQQGFLPYVLVLHERGSVSMSFYAPQGFLSSFPALASKLACTWSGSASMTSCQLGFLALGSKTTLCFPLSVPLHNSWGRCWYNYFLAVRGIYFLLFLHEWVPNRQFWVKTRLKRSIIVYS